ncbi:dehydrogenase [Candidatus Epulonipiscium fishelsonii]|uniref:Dehydrogenase n=1 Tax=Candidatus Epulonipiscium fishelsonii TaxID=77094 RepID=A0ACC8XF48_9FIRM|nr:dehydrogenase [Epulopiscium sp. SCG-B05WGA-EpuloA1]ONI41967.1 dehydrogenase [Epulopiscium sp. SCG-B11WGA-EpuloA1]
MMKKVRLGIIGMGQQGGFYLGTLTGIQINPGKPIEKADLEQIEVTAVSDIDPAKREKIKSLLPNIHVYDNYIDMLDSGNVDAIVTTVSHYLHSEMGIEALKRNIHVLLEKPAGVYTKQVQELIDVAKGKPELTFAVFFNQRMNPLYRKLKEIIDNGEIGEIRRTNWIITTWYRPQAYYDMSAWRATWEGEGGGVLVNQAPHQIDLMQWLCGMPKKVYAKCQYGYQRDIAVEDDVTALFDYGNGATGVLVTCTHDIVGSDRLEILGDKGKIVVNNSRTVTITRLKKSESEINAQITDLTEVYKLMRGSSNIQNELIDVETIEFDNVWGQQHIDILKNFAANILDKTPLVAPGSDGIRGVRLANAIHLSSWLNKEIDIDFDENFFYEKLQEKIREEKNEQII